MINEALVLLKNRLNGYLNAGWSFDESREDQVVFIDGEKMDSLTFKLGAVSVLLINVEEENVIRSPDRYRRTGADGTQYRVQPEIRLNLYVLFVARYKQYEEALRYLSLIIQYFQAHPLLEHPQVPELGDDSEPLVIELITLPLAEQNHIWSSLRVAYHPSVLYKVKMVVFQDQDQMRMPEISEKTLRVLQ
jgi:hypothetical protein